MKNRYRLGLSVVLAASASMVVVSPSVSADDCVSNFPWASETELINYQGSPALGCDRNFVVDPGEGNLLQADSTTGIDGFLTPARVSFYVAEGFNENFLWYANRTTTATGPGDGRRWTACTVGIPEGSICPTLKNGLMGPDFTQNTPLHIVGDDNVFIALGCGNYSADTQNQPPPVPTPTPYFDGIKFRDNNRDGDRDAGEATLSGWTIKITQQSSLVGPPEGSWTVTTNASGYYRFDLLGHSPGRYMVEEIPQSGWQNYTPISYTIDVDFGVGNRQYTRNFGNAETIVDVAKTDIRVLDAPATLEVNTPTDVTVSVTIDNLGPADQVPVRDELVAVLPEDCSTPSPRQEFVALLRRNDPPLVHDFVFTITCTRPSEHQFQFDDVLSIINPQITDVNPSNNRASTGFTVPVHAYTDLGVGAELACPGMTDVGVPINCDVEITVTNDGFGPIDATVAAQLALPNDCVSDPAPATLDYDDLVDGASVTQTQTFVVTCSYRSFHPIEVSAAVSADDIHVFDTNTQNDAAGDGPSIVEVFHDATMAATDVHLVCSETLGTSPFTCTATVEYVKAGPAPMVEVVLYAVLDGLGDCTAGPDPHQDQTFILGDQQEVRTFTWTVDCPPSEVLHSAKVTTDIGPSGNEPHAVDVDGPIIDWWVVPYCLPTENPHGKKQPQAPGNGGQGQNQDGFYIFGTLADQLGEQVFIRDDESGVVFGPFDNGTRIKWVEANGATPSITAMGGNNGNGNGQANAVDYQIKAQGDAQAFFIDERGIEVSVTCLVPPFPK